MAALRQSGMKVPSALRQLGVAKSTFYSWRPAVDGEQRRTVNRLLSEERAAIINAQQGSPHLRHRVISGLLRHEDIWVSPSSCYRILRAEDLIEPYERREAPWDKPRYEPCGPNLLWGEDWTKLLIAGRRWYLLVLLDLFSRLIVAWDVVPTVTQRDVKELVAQGMLSQGLDRQGIRRGGPRLRTDCGSPNVAGSVKEFLDDIGVDLSLGRVRRPTDNARVERCNGTLKQEEIYCQGAAGYLSPEGARLSLGRYIDYYCHRRPHQELWNFTPAHVHTVGNKTTLLKEYREKVEQARQRRLRHNRTEVGVRLSTSLAKSV
jgi:putative transposase